MSKVAKATAWIVVARTAFRRWTLEKGSAGASKPAPSPVAAQPATAGGAGNWEATEARAGNVTEARAGNVTEARAGNVTEARPRTVTAADAPEAGEEHASIPPQGKGGPGPDTPLDLGPSDWKETLTRTLKEIKDDRLTFAAAGMTYYFFLAIFPTLIAVVGIMGFVNADTSGLIASIRSTLPGDSGQALTEAFREANRPSDATSLTAAIVGISVALWSASTGMVALQTGLNVVYDVAQDRKFFGKRVVALLLVVATLLLGGVPSPIFTFGEAPVYVALGWVLTILAVMLLFSLFYYFAPNRDAPRWQWVSVGGIVGATLWILALLAFGYYVDSYSNYSRTYGSLAGVVVLMLVLYLSSLAVLIGGELNAEMERQGQRLAASNRRHGHR